MRFHSQNHVVMMKLKSITSTILLLAVCGGYAGCDKEPVDIYSSSSFYYIVNGEKLSGRIGDAICSDANKCATSNRVDLHFRSNNEFWIESVGFTIPRELGRHECYTTSSHQKLNDSRPVMRYHTTDLGGDVSMALWNLIEDDEVEDFVNVLEITDTHITGEFQGSFVVRARSRWLDPTIILPDTVVIREGQFIVPIVDIE